MKKDESFSYLGSKILGKAKEPKMKLTQTFWLFYTKWVTFLYWQQE